MNFAKELLNTFDLTHLDQGVIQATEVAVPDKTAFYLFLQRYTHFNGFAGSLVARLASSIGLSRDLFRANCPMVDAADRGLEIAAKVFAATIDEHADRMAQCPHRTLAQGLLQKVGDYAGLNTDQRNHFSVVPAWMSEILTVTVAGYQGIPGDPNALLRSLGFHAASEVLASREYALIDQVVCHDNRDHGFDAYLKSAHGKLEIAGRPLGAWYWIVIHGQHQQSGVEAEHFEWALDALNLAIEYRPESPALIMALAAQGFAEFVELQQRLFREIQRECEAIVSSTPALVG